MKNKGQAKKGTMKRLIRMLFEFYPVLLPVTMVCILINAIVSVWKRFRNITKAALIRFCSPHLTRKINFPGDRV